MLVVVFRLGDVLIIPTHLGEETGIALLIFRAVSIYDENFKVNIIPRTESLERFETETLHLSI